jgi:protein-S-isoprenylcysteine O-methyltransferase Ste14
MFARLIPDAEVPTPVSTPSAIHVAQLPQRLGRWLAFTSLFVIAVLLVAGRIDLPFLNLYLAVSAALFLVATMFVDLDLLRERTRRGQQGADPKRLVLLRLSFLACLATALLDVGRFHWSDTVPGALQIGALLLAVGAMAWTFWALVVNRFFVPVIRIQPERGHRVVADGPYAWVRHPGYAGNVLSAPASVLAIGSWWALAPALLVSLLFVLRTAHEDRFLKERLAGYPEYAARVRYRLVPNLW